MDQCGRVRQVEVSRAGGVVAVLIASIFVVRKTRAQEYMALVDEVVKSPLNAAIDTAIDQELDKIKR